MPITVEIFIPGPILKIKVMTLNDLRQIDDWFYVGDIIDIDGYGWVSKEDAELILLEYNAGVQK